MIKHKDTIILVTFTAGDQRFERFALQSADCTFIKSINPAGYKFVDVEAVRNFLREQKQLVLRNRDEDEFSYLKASILGGRWDECEPGEHDVNIWYKYGRTVKYKDIVIEKAVAFDKATDTETDITEEFKAIWNVGHNPPTRIKTVCFAATVRCTVDAKVYIWAPADTSEAELVAQAGREFNKANVQYLSNGSGKTRLGIEKASTPEVMVVVPDDED